MTGSEPDLPELEQETTISDLATLPDDDGEAFVGSVMKACGERAAPRSTRPLAYLISFASAAAITTALVMTTDPPARGPREAAERESREATEPKEAVEPEEAAEREPREVAELTPRGRAAPQAQTARVEAFVGKRGGNGPAPLLEGAELHAGEGIVVRYSNPTDKDAFLMVFAVDSKLGVHWIHPAYLREDENPSSIRLLPRSERRTLDEVAEPDTPAPGAMRVYALITAAPLAVRDVEGALARNHGTLDGLFPDATVEAWRCTWRSE